MNGTTGYVINGTVDGFGQGIELGGRVGRLGDVNGDGYDDLLLSSVIYNSPTNAENSGQGKVYVIYGRSYGKAVYDIATLDISTGFTILGESTGAYFGSSLGGGGDVNGDGYYDLLMGAYEDSSTNYLGGKAYLIYGSDFLGNTYYEGDAGDNKYKDYGGFYFYPKQGDDFIYVDSGPDYAFLGQGDDGIGMNPYGTFSNAMIGKIDGGKGWDFLWIRDDSGDTVDLTAVANNRIKRVETINLDEVEYSGVSRNHTLILATQDIMAMLDSDKHIFSVNGDLGDSVTVTDGAWTYNGTPIRLRIDTDITSTTVPKDLILPIVPIIPILPVLP